MSRVSRKQARAIQRQRVHADLMAQAANHPVQTPRDEDMDISVVLTGDDDLECIQITLGTKVVKVHTRQAIDLHRKLGLALTDWVAESAIMLASEMGRLGL